MSTLVWLRIRAAFGATADPAPCSCPETEGIEAARSGGARHGCWSLPMASANSPFAASSFLASAGDRASTLVASATSATASSLEPLAGAIPKMRASSKSAGGGSG